MIPRWLEDAAAFTILWCALALIAGVTIGAWIGRHHPTRDGETEAWEQEHKP